MRITDIIRRSGRSLRSAKMRTLLTAMAIGVGGFTLSLTLAAGNGVRDYTDKLIASNFDPAELIVGRDKEISNSGAPSSKPQEYDESISSFSGPGGDASIQFKRVTRQDIEALKANPAIEQVRENYQISVRYITREGQKRYTGGAEPYNPAQKPEIIAGVLPTEGDIKKGGILLPDTYLDILGFESAESALGQTISIAIQKPFSLEAISGLLGSMQSPEAIIAALSNAAPEEKLVSYTIAGITKKPATSLTFGVSPILVSSADGRDLYDFTTKGTSDYDKYLYVFVRVKDGQDESVLRTVQQSLIDGGYYVQSIKDIQKTITQFVDILQIMVGVLGAITLIASIFGIVNTMYISVLERTREIGLMKALGMSRKNISLLFVFEAAWIGFLGGVIGITLGFILGTAVNPWLTRKLSLGEGNSLLIFDLLQTAILLSALMLIGALSGVLPARKAAKLDPVEALRTE